MSPIPKQETDTIEFKTSFNIEAIETLVAFANRNVEKSVEKNVEKDVEKSVEKIIETLKGSPFITQKELEEITGLTRRGVERNIRNLRENGFIERIGPAKGSHWKVLK